MKITVNQPSCKKWKNMVCLFMNNSINTLLLLNSRKVLIYKMFISVQIQNS